VENQSVAARWNDFFADAEGAVEQMLILTPSAK
jgi:hypothetical protein